MPGTTGAPAGAADRGAAMVGAQDPKVLTQDKFDKSLANKQFHLRAEEGTIDVPRKVEAKAGVEATAEVKLAPAAGYKVATDFPTKLQLMETPGVKLEKTYLTAGGRAKAQGDAQTLSEQALAFAVKATPEAAGAYEIKGVFTFGVCEKDSCHPRTQPITIQVAAN